jgi:1,5-anhydro-D-fructose reductase (1,5-anhydro-D-mannitol-forming)
MRSHEAKKVRYALIGFGGIAENRISKEGFCLDSRRFRQHPAAELAGATDLNRSRREAVEAAGLRWYGSVEALLEDPQVQAVFIATDNLSHAPLALRALKAGKHVLVEKPMATRLEDARRLVALARKLGLSLGVDHMMVHNAYSQKAVELLRAGELGEVNDLSLHMEFLYGASAQERSSWRCSRPGELGGPLGDVGSHCLYMAEHLAGSRIRSLACTYLPPTLKLAVENGAFVQFETSSGVQGSLRVAFNQPRGGAGGTLSNLGYEIYGSLGVLRGYGTLFQLSGYSDEPVAVRLELDRFRRVERVRVRPIRNIYQSLIQAHAESIRANRPMDGEEGLHNLELVLKCHESAHARGKRLTLKGEREGQSAREAGRG